MDFCEPRYATRRRPERQTFGWRIANSAKALGTPLMEWQQYVADVGMEMVWQELPNGKSILVPAYREIVVTIPRQNGKGLERDTRLPTPSGWTTMGDIRVGDELFDEAGAVCRVTFVSEDRLLDCYRASFSDGTSVVADGDHLWRLYDVWGHDESPGRWVTLTTRELVGRANIGNRGKQESRYRLPDVGALDLDEVNLPIDPWLLGAWLGDGTSTTATLTVGDEDLAEMRALVESTGATTNVKSYPGKAHSLRVNIGAEMRDGFEARLKRFNLYNEKHIPDLWLRSSFAQRLALLQGLMDTDGHVAINGSNRTSRRCEISLNDERLALDVLELVRTLGIRATWRTDQSKLYGRVTGTRHRISFNTDLPVFRLKRKSDRLAGQGPLRKRSRMLLDVTPVPTVATRCIQVDSPSSLFRCGEGMVPTHNTTLVLSFEVDRCLMWGKPQRVAYTAQTGLDARKKVLEDQLPMIQRSILKDAIANVRKAQGSEGIDFLGGSQLDVLASTESAGHGRTLDLGVIDEAFKDTDDRREGAMLPAMVTRAEAQLLVVSTMGTDASLYLNRKVDAGRDLALSDRDDAEIAYFEWAAPEDADIDDPRTWQGCMPAYGVTITDRAVRHARETMTEGEFRRAYLNQRTATEDRILGADVWSAVNGNVQADGKMVFAIDCNPERTHSAIAECDLDGRCEIVEHDQGTAWLVAQTVEKAKRWNAPVAYDPTGPAGVFGDELAKHGIQTIPISGRDLAHACSLFFDAVIDAKIRVRPHGGLNAAVAAARQRISGDAWVWGRRGGEQDLSPLVAMTIAYFAAMRGVDPVANVH